MNLYEFFFFSFLFKVKIIKICFLFLLIKIVSPIKRLILFVNIFFTKLTWVFYLLLYETIKTHLFTEKNRIGLFFMKNENIFY